MNSLSEEERKRFKQLMNSAMSSWPKSLIQELNKQKSISGGVISDTALEWVKKNPGK